MVKTEHKPEKRERTFENTDETVTKTVALINWLKRWGIPAVITLVVVCAAILLLWSQVWNCWGQWTTWPSLAEQILSSYLPPSSCMKPNEIGDFLAGVFAPIAFIWLACAVVLQSYELAAQRKELTFARKVAEEQTKATLAQASHAERNADLVQSQLVLSEEEHRRKEEAEAKEQFHIFLNEIRLAFVFALEGSSADGPDIDYLTAHGARDRASISDIMRNFQSPDEVGIVRTYTGGQMTLRDYSRGRLGVLSQNAPNTALVNGIRNRLSEQDLETYKRLKIDKFCELIDEVDHLIAS